MKKGLTSNGLKIIAIITMIIDHIGHYMYPFLTSDTYYLFRNIGRISMPLFAYLIVQGFFHTKSIKKYIARLFSIALLTQAGLLLLGYVNKLYYPSYIWSSSTMLNILFSYALSLILLTFIDRKNVISKFSDSKNLIIKLIISIIIMSAYFILDFDYGLRIPFIMIGLYFIEKFFKKDLSQFKDKLIYISLILVLFLLSLAFVPNGIVWKYSMLISLVFIVLYNGQKGNNNKFIRNLFYLFFPIHHFLIYSLTLFLLIKGA